MRGLIYANHMAGKAQTLRSTLLAIAGASMVALLGFSTVAGATDVERSGVRDLGGNSTESFSSSLVIQQTSPIEYERGCCTDSDSGEWLGPRYVASDIPSISGRSGIDWSVEANTRASSAQAAAEQSLIHNFQIGISSAATSVKHYVGSQLVGTLPAHAIVKRADAPSTINAEYEATLAFPLASRIYAVARFSLLSPSADQTGMGGQFLVESSSGSVLASTWNGLQATTSLGNVVLIGNLPPASVSARATSARRKVAGKVKDLFSHPLVGQSVRLQRKVGRRWQSAGSDSTSSSGGYSIRVSRSGVYRAKVVLGGVEKYSRTVRAGS